jgi:hypothetical protein
MLKAFVKKERMDKGGAYVDVSSEGKPIVSA